MFDRTCLTLMVASALAEPFEHFVYIGVAVYKTESIVGRSVGAKVRDDVLTDVTPLAEVTLTVEPIVIAVNSDSQSLVVCFERNSNLFAQIFDIPTISQKVIVVAM